MTNKSVDRLLEFVKSLGINPWVFSAIVCMGFLVFRYSRGDFKNWKQLDSATRMNDILILVAAVGTTILAVLNLLGMVTH